MKNISVDARRLCTGRKIIPTKLISFARRFPDCMLPIQRSGKHDAETAKHGCPCPATLANILFGPKHCQKKLIVKTNRNSDLWETFCNWRNHTLETVAHAPSHISPWGRESERIKIWKDEKKTTISKCLWHLLCNVRRFDERLQLRWFRVGNLVLFCIPETIDRNCDLQPSLCLLFFRLLRHRHPSVYNEYFAVPPGFQPSIRSVQQNHSRSGCHRTKYSFQAGCSGMHWDAVESWT